MFRASASEELTKLAEARIVLQNIQSGINSQVSNPSRPFSHRTAEPLKRRVKLP